MIRVRVRITRPSTAESSRYAGKVGTVIGDWSAREGGGATRGYLVEFPDGEVLRVLLPEIDEID